MNMPVESLWLFFLVKNFSLVDTAVSLPPETYRISLMCTSLNKKKLYYLETIEKNVRRCV